MATKDVVDNLEFLLSSSTGINNFREFIGTLAVSGKLTSNFDPTDSATDLIVACSEYLQVHPEMSEPRFDIPVHWEWVPLASIAEHQLGKMLNTSKMRGIKRPYLRSVNIRQNGTIDLSDVKEMLLSEEEAIKYSVRTSDLFVNEGGDVGRSAIFNLEVESTLVFQNALHRLRTICQISSEYLNLVIQQAKSQGVIAAMSSGVTIQHFSASSIRKLAIPLPPLSEQLEIVKRVSEISSFCDLIQQNLMTSQHLSIAARKSAVDAVSKAQTTEELQVAWDRIRFNWEVIAGTPEAIDSLRKLILSLAAKGELVNIPKQLREDSPYVELSKVCKVSWGNLSLTKSSYVDNGAYLAVSAAGPDGRIGTAEHKAFTPVLSAIGARCGTMFMPSEDFTAIKNTMTLRPKNDLLNNWYLLYTMMGSNLPRRGSAQPFMSKSDIENLRIRVPSLDEQRLIATSVEELLQECDYLEAKLRESAALAEKFSNSVVSSSV